MHENYDLDLLLELVEQRKFRSLKELLSQMNEVDIAEFLDELDAFHKQSYIILNLSPNFMASCCDISAQLDSGIVHFPLMSR